MMVNSLSPPPRDIADRRPEGFPVAPPGTYPAPASMGHEFELDVDRKHDDDDDDREDAQDERHRELGREAVGLFLGNRHPLMAHVVAVDPKRLGKARSQLLGLLQQGGERAGLFE